MHSAQWSQFCGPNGSGVDSAVGYPIQAYSWCGLSLDDSPPVLRHLGGPEIYALDLERR
jgi:hypothetical protein